MLEFEPRYLGSRVCGLFFFFNLFVCFWLCWIFVATCQLSLVAASGATLHLWRMVFSLRRLLLLQSAGPRVQ